MAVVMAVGSTPGGGTQATAAAPSLTVAFDGDTGLPHLTHSSNAPAYTGEVVVTGGPISNVRLEFTGEGVIADPAVIEIAGPTSSFTFSTKAYSTGGFHNVVVHVSSDNTVPDSQVGPLLYAAGGDAIPATGDLTGVAYGYTDLARFEGGDGRTSSDHLLTFVDADTALFGAPDGGAPRCSRPDEDLADGCVRYRYDESTGLVVVGAFPGKVVGKKLWISRGNPADDDDSYSSERFLTDHVAYPEAGKRFSGRWSGGEVKQFDWQPHYQLTLQRQGAFALRIFPGRGKPMSVSGTYRITAPGRLVLVRRSGRRTVHLLGVSTRPNGTPQPKKGVWVTFRTPDSSGTGHHDEDVHLTWRPSA
ncbi:hypothetical protein [Nocardioides sp.]|uniref:hypothetical protein n=1 Tax=Nocardioides sp. TaxID=35761 RepID=UPI001A246D2C|nr:hypothetical protein [Nocardioides sp.]MBJ7359264.1 hypothetical protein [Nocardioides sp.]